MTKTTSNRFSPEVRQRAVRMVLVQGGNHGSQWAAIGSIAARIGCTAETLRKRVRQAQSDRDCGSARRRRSRTGSRCVAGRVDSAKRPPRARQDLALTEQIRRVHAANFGVHGARKVWRQLVREGIAVARCMVERPMRRMGLRGVGWRVSRTAHAAFVLDALEQALHERRPAKVGFISS